MARQVTRMPASEYRRYPWDHWLNGAVWELEAGKDFHVHIDRFRATAHTAAKRRGLGITIRRNGLKKIYMQAIPKEGTE